MSDDFNFAFRSAKLRVLPTEEWMNYGACKDLDTGIFFQTGNQHFYKAAKAICASCVHRSECLDYALAHRIDDGVWGGLTGRERRRVLRLALSDPEPSGLAYG